MKAYRGKMGKVLRCLIVRAQVDEDLRQAIGERCMQLRREVVRQIIHRAIDRGELPEGLDADIVLDAIYGPIDQRLLVPYDKALLSNTFIDQVVDSVFAGLEP